MDPNTKKDYDAPTSFAFDHASRLFTRTLSGTDLTDNRGAANGYARSYPCCIGGDCSTKPYVNDSPNGSPVLP